VSTLQTRRALKAREKKVTHELTRAAAHEIKNCLTGIKGCLQVLEQDFPDAAPQKRVMREVLGDVGRLEIAVETLSLLAAFPEPDLVPVSVNAVIQDVKTTLESQRCGRLDVEFAPRAVPEIMTDPEQLRLALLNIAAHCIHAMGEEGGIVFAARERRRNCEVEISIADRGAAGDSAGSSPFEETGTTPGLAIGRRIIECNKGRMDVTGGKGARTTVSIILSAKERE
jgi:nitrogen-specific signal transduction histidine kinase